MTLEEIESALPNGLHDGRIISLHQDFAKAELVLQLALIANTHAQPDLPLKSAELRFQKVLFCLSDPPESESAFRYPESELWILSFSSNSEKFPNHLRSSLPSETLCYSIFIHDWFAEIHIAAANVEFRWLDGDVFQPAA